MDDLDSLLANARRGYSPDPEAKHRVRTAVSVALAGSTVVGTTGGAKAAAVGSKVGVAKLGGAAGASAGVKFLAVAALLASVGGGYALWTLPSASETMSLPAPAAAVAVTVASPEVKPVSEERGATSRPEEVEATSPTAEDPPAPDTARATRRAAKPVESTSSTLIQELTLIRQASEQLRAGQAQEALHTLAEHRARFPKSVVATEREGLTVLAQCSQGASAAHRAAAERFLGAWPNAPLAPHIRKQCLK